jgi:hypothetical protein
MILWVFLDILELLEADMNIKVEPMHTGNCHNAIHSICTISLLLLSVLHQLLDAVHHQAAVGQLVLVGLQLPLLFPLELSLHLHCPHCQRRLHPSPHVPTLPRPRLLLRPQRLPPLLLLPHHAQATQLLPLQLLRTPQLQLLLTYGSLTCILPESSLYC